MTLTNVSENAKLVISTTQPAYVDMAYRSSTGMARPVRINALTYVDSNGSATDLTVKVLELHTADTALGVRIDTESADRALADTNEQSARIAADSALGIRIDSEAFTREQEDIGLDQKIDAETTLSRLASSFCAAVIAVCLAKVSAEIFEL